MSESAGASGNALSGAERLPREELLALAHRLHAEVCNLRRYCQRSRRVNTPAAATFRYPEAGAGLPIRKKPAPTRTHEHQASALQSTDCSANSSLAWPEERAAMSELYAQSWDASAAHVCEWRGVTCGSDCRVSGIDLKGHPTFIGTLPRSLAALKRLVSLDAMKCELSGTLDGAFAAWSQLQYLRLGSSQLSGSLDGAFVAWGQLQILYLAGTQLSGSLDPAFAAWSQLSGLYLFRSQLSGSLDPSFVTWTQLQQLGLFSTQLSGTLDRAFTTWSQLDYLGLQSTQLSGSLDPAFTAWTKLRLLALSDTQLSGSLHSAFSAWSQLLFVSLSDTQLSGSLDPAFGAWRLLAELVLSTPYLSGTLDPAFANWTQLQLLDVSRSGLSGSLPPSLSAWTQLEQLDVSGTALSGGLWAEFSAWKSLNTLRVSETKVTFVAVPIFQLPSLQLLDASYSRLTFNTSAADSCPQGVLVDVVSLSGNKPGMSLEGLVSCLLGNATSFNASSVTWLKLQDMDLTGPLFAEALHGSSVNRLDLGRNKLTADERYASYSLLQSLEELIVSENPLSSAFALDIVPIPSVNISYTGVYFCYDGLVPASLSSLSLRGVRPQPSCNRAKERPVSTSMFSACEGAGTAVSRALNGTLCRHSASRVVFSGTRLTCPSWSTFPSRGAAKLDVDAAFLDFWGCTCPPDFYWGYSDARSLAAESAALRQRPDMSLGELERILQGRSCLPCPDDTSVQCSALAVVDPPHVVTRSVYPFVPGRFLNRSVLPYLSHDQLRSCMHPAVCGGDSLFIGDNWTQWALLASSGAAFRAPFTQFQCRAGHDAATPLCAGCLSGYWLDGFLCRRCFAGAEALVVLGVLAGLGALCYVVWRHHRPVTRGAVHHFLTVILWFFQVAHALQLSQQINAAHHSNTGADELGLAVYLPVLSFRPWALECLLPGWSFRTSSAALFTLAWAVGAAGVAVPAWRRSCVLLLDLMYLPVAQRAVQWFNTMRLPREDDNVSRLPCEAAADTRILSSAAQCVLQLSPSTACDGGMTAFAALTFAVFTCGFFLGAAALAWWHSDHPLVGFFTRPYARDGRRWRWLWAVPHRFARKLWFALLIAGWPFSDTKRAASLALLVFASLLALLALAVWLRPYADPRDNRLEMACLLLLLYGNFVSVLPESSAGMSASVTVLQVVLLVHGAHRWLRQRFVPLSAADGRDHLGSDGNASEADSALSGEPLPAGRIHRAGADGYRAGASAAPSYRDSAGGLSEFAVPLMAIGAHADERVSVDSDPLMTRAEAGVARSE